MADTSKRIEGDITWGEAHGHPAAVSFRESIESEAGYPLSVKGYLNRNSGKLTFVLLHRAESCIYRLDLGTEHPWVEGVGARDAYVPPDITAAVEDPVSVWSQFCEEANMTHAGAMNEPPPQQMDMML